MLTPLDLAAIAGYFLILLWIGLRVMRQAETHAASQSGTPPIENPAQPFGK